jgi:cephalosporin hydroxylase
MLIPRPVQAYATPEYESLYNLGFQYDQIQWQMTPAERWVLIALVRELAPTCALEIGTSHGGSLSVLTRFAAHVYSLDIDPTCAARLAVQYPNVTFITGNSADTLPGLLAQLQQAAQPPGFILIDGDHSYYGVKRDIEIVLTHIRPTQPLYILMHDSFYPDCRRGIRDAAWTACPYVHAIELDFVPGIFHQRAPFYRQMFGGFAFAVLLPAERDGPLTITAEQNLLFQTVLGHSLHAKTCSVLVRELVTVMRYKLQGVFYLLKQRMFARAKH